MTAKQNIDYIVESDFVYKGFRCVGVGARLGQRCGYITLPMRYRKLFEDNECDIEVHGGWTFQGENNGYPVKVSSDIYWIGFDCAHIYDIQDRELIESLNTPEDAKVLLDSPLMLQPTGYKRDKDYVVGELKQAVDQIVELIGV